jgi:glutamate formiminotransferase
MPDIDDNHKRKILEVISKHVGKKKPVQVSDLMSFVPLSDREIRKVIQELILDFGEPIGSTTKGPHGFYFIADQDDLDETVNNLENRRDMIDKRIKALKKQLEIPQINPQTTKQKCQTVINISNSIIIHL